VVLIPAFAHAGSNFSFFFGFGGAGCYAPYYPAYSGCYAPRYYAPSYFYGYYPPVYRPYSYGFGLGYYGGGYKGYKGSYGGGYYGGYSKGRSYYPYRYADYRSDYRRNYTYRRGHDYGSRYSYGRGSGYYGPAVERYQRNARDYPSYHYDRREAYNSPGRSGAVADRGSRYGR
jgi:hypothetical protein